MERGIVVELTGNVLDGLDYAIAVFAVVRGNVQSHLRPVWRHIADDLDGAVGNNMECAIRVPQRSATHGDLFHRSADRAGTNRVSDLKLVFRQNEEAVDHVFDQGLCPETNRHPDNTGAGQQRLDINTEKLQRLHDRHKKNGKDSRAVNHAGQRLDLLGARSATKRSFLAQLADLPGQQPEHAYEDEGDHQDHDQPWAAVTRPPDQVVMPIAQ